MINKLFLRFLPILLFMALLSPGYALAQRVQITVTCENGQQVTYDDGASSAEEACKGVGSSSSSGSYNCPDGTTIGVPGNFTSDQSAYRCYELGHSQGQYGTSLVVDSDGKKIYDMLQNGLNLFTLLAGVAITAGVIIGGIQYSAAGGNPQSVAKAKGHITNAVIALVTLIFLYSFLQWLIPGGIFAG